MKNKIAIGFILLASLMSFFLPSCKEEEEKEVSQTYETKIISGDNQSILAGERSKPILIALQRGGKNAPVKSYFKISFVLPNCSGSNSTFSNENYNSPFTYHTDGTLQFHFDAISSPGTHILTLTIKDLDDNIMGTKTINYTVLPKSKGWIQTCYKGGFPIIKCNSKKLITYFQNEGMFQSVDNGKTWTPLISADPAYIQKIVYDHWNNIIYIIEDVIHYSKDEGQTWEYFIPFKYVDIDDLPKPTKEGKLVLPSDKRIITYDHATETYKEIFSNLSISDFVQTNNGHCYMLDNYGNIFHSATLEGNYVRLNNVPTTQELVTDYITVFAIGEKDVYQTTNDGQTWNKVGTLPENMYFKNNYNTKIAYSAPYFSLIEASTQKAYRTSDFSTYTFVGDGVEYPYTLSHHLIFFANGGMLKQSTNGYIYVYEP